jgi:hypothetical protein
LTFLVWQSGGFETRSVPALGLVAAQDLPAGHLLQPNDLAPLTPTYLKQKVDKGNPIAPASTGSSPDITTKPGFVTIAFPVDRKLIAEGKLNAGKKAQVCAVKKQILTDVGVQFVACFAEESNGTCLGILDVPADKVSSVRSTEPMTVQPGGPKCE